MEIGIYTYIYMLCCAIAILSATGNQSLCKFSCKGILIINTKSSNIQLIHLLSLRYIKSFFFVYEQNRNIFFTVLEKTQLLLYATFHNIQTVFDMLYTHMPCLNCNIQNKNILLKHVLLAPPYFVPTPPKLMFP